MTRSRQTRRPTLKDVAAHAGVSLSTASLVFSGRGPVAPATAARVQDAAAALGYAGPDPLAASLRNGRAGVIGVATDAALRTAFQDPFAVAVLDGIAGGLDDVGSGLLLVSHEAPPSQALDAMIFPLCGPVTTPFVDRLLARRTPIVATGAPDGPGVVHLRVDNHRATAEITRLLVDLGHHRVAHLTMPMEPGQATGRLVPAQVTTATYPDSRDRARGFLSVAGVRAPMAVAAETTVDAGAAAAALLLDRDPRPTAIVAQSDLLAAGVIRAATERGLRVPDDLSVVGFDGVDLPWLTQRLTTVDQDAGGLGRHLAELALALAAGDRVRTRTHPTRLVRGQTTARPAG